MGKGAILDYSSFTPVNVPLVDRNKFSQLLLYFGNDLVNSCFLKLLAVIRNGFLRIFAGFAQHQLNTQL
ncbi:hypothetical protein D3C86_1861930 [compost metagenome]